MTLGALLFRLRSTLIVFHAGEICKANFYERSEVIRAANEMVRRGVVLCPLCYAMLKVHSSYPRHCRDENGVRHDGWCAQCHCEACEKYPALLPDFLMPHKHYKAEVIEAVIADSEVGVNFENFGDHAADISTMRRWVRQFKVRGVQAVGWLTSVLLTVYELHICSLELRCRTLLKQLARLLREYPSPKSGGVIGSANIILTTRSCGFL